MKTASDFSSGFYETLQKSANFTNLSITSQLSGEYVSKIDEILNQGFSDFIKTAGTEQALPNRTGFVAEEFHNLQAKLYLAKHEIEGDAERLKSNLKDSADYKIITPTGETYIQVKYWENPQDTLNDLMSHNYIGMKKIVPWGQVKDIKDIIDKKIDKLPIGSNHEANDQIEKLLEIKRTVVSKTFGESHAASKKTMTELTEQAEKGRIDKERHHFRTIDNVDFTEIFKNSLEAGAQAAIIGGVLNTAPVLFEQTKNWIQGREFDGKKITEPLIMGARKSFIRGTVSAAVYNSCKLGLLGESLKDVDPTGVASVTVVALRAIENSIKLFNGEITEQQFANQLIKDSILTSSCYLGSIAGQALIPIPILGAAIGSIVGGLIGSFIFGSFETLILKLTYRNNLLIAAPLRKMIEQDYKLPDEILNNLKINLISLSRPRIATIDLAPTELSSNSYSKVNVPFIKRGLIGFNKEGYLLQTI